MSGKFIISSKIIQFI